MTNSPMTREGTSRSPMIRTLWVIRLNASSDRIHRGKSYVSHLVELPQLLHDELANDPGRHLAVTDDPYLVGDTAQRFIRSDTPRQIVRKPPRRAAATPP